MHGFYDCCFQITFRVLSDNPVQRIFEVSLDCLFEVTSTTFRNIRLYAPPQSHLIKSFEVRFSWSNASVEMQSIDDSIFKVNLVDLQFSISSDFVAAQVANNVLILALSTGRLLRIDLDSPADIDGLARPVGSPLPIQMS